MHLTIYNFLGQQRSGKTVNKRKAQASVNFDICCSFSCNIEVHRHSNAMSEVALIGVDQEVLDLAYICARMLSADTPLRLSPRTLATQQRLHLFLQASVRCDQDACRVFRWDQSCMHTRTASLQHVTLLNSPGQQRSLARQPISARDSVNVGICCSF